MDLGMILLLTGIVVIVFILIIDRNSRIRSTNRIWTYQKKQSRIRAVGPCAVAVGVYKTYEDRKRLEKMRSESKLSED